MGFHLFVEWPRELIFGVWCCVASVMCFATLLWKRIDWRDGLSKWRYRVSWTGLIVGFASAFSSIFLMLVVQYRGGLPTDASFWNYAARAALWMCFFGLMTAPLLLFGKGKIRWLGLLSACVTFLGTYFVLANLD
jgi:hypothetical protein